MSRRPCEITGCPNTTKRASGRCPDHRYADRDARGPVPPPAEATARAVAAEAALRDGLGDGPRITATAFVSGAVDLEVRTGDALAVIQSGPGGQEWGVSLDPPDDPAGYDHVVGSMDEAVHLLRNRRPAG